MSTATMPAGTETAGAMGMCPEAMRTRLGRTAAMKMGTPEGDLASIMWKMGAASRATRAGMSRNRIGTGMHTIPMMT